MKISNALFQAVLSAFPSLSNHQALKVFPSELEPEPEQALRAPANMAIPATAAPALNNNFFVVPIVDLQ
ncbi:MULTISPECIES: hypothetical protein [unclassified Microbacterium]|uniref:hypothetical protein n=1 Tax=unclassified Microbacterium TaxID=2609290 RepID=UPI0036488050